MRKQLKEIALGVIPIVLFITVLHFTLTPLGAERYVRFLLSSVLIVFGISIFLYGVNVALVPLGKDIGSSLVKKGSVSLLLLFGLIIGFAATIPEPAVLTIIAQLPIENLGIPVVVIHLVTAASVGLFILLSFLTIFLRVPIKYTLTVIYAAIVVLLIAAPVDFKSIAIDVGTLTTGSLTVPFFMALGSGIAAVTARDEKSQSSFGVVALASMGPIIAILLLGVLTRWV